MGYRIMVTWFKDIHRFALHRGTAIILRFQIYCHIQDMRCQCEHDVRTIIRVPHVAVDMVCRIDMRHHRDVDIMIISNSNSHREVRPNIDRHRLAIVRNRRKYIDVEDRVHRQRRGEFENFKHYQCRIRLFINEFFV